MTEHLKSGRLELAFNTHGVGDHLLIFIHGYGKDKSDFSGLMEELPEQYKSVSLDIPFHGDSENNDLGNEIPISKSEWVSWMNDFIASQKCASFSLIGYSIGGRLALCYAESRPVGLRRLLLLAPDGFIKNPWNILFTRNPLGRFFFRSGMKNGHRTDGFIKLLATAGLLSGRKLKLVEHNIQGKKAKMKLYNTWVMLRELWPEKAWLKDSNGMDWDNVILLMGSHDSMILWKSVRYRIPELHMEKSIQVLNSGHDMMSRSVMNKVKAILIQPSHGQE